MLSSFSTPLPPGFARHTHLVGAGAPLWPLSLAQLISLAQAQQRNILGTSSTTPTKPHRLAGTAGLAVKVAPCQELAQGATQ